MADRKYLTAQAILEWAFMRERAQLELPARDVDPEQGFGFGMEYVLIQRARLGGVQIDGGGPKLKDCHEDAEAVAAVVSNLPDDLGGRRMAIAMAECSRCGMPPDWMPGAAPRVQPKDWVSRRKEMTGRKELVGHWIEEIRQAHPRNPAKTIKRSKKHEIWVVPITFDPHPQTIDLARREYAAWHRALVFIKDALQNSGTLRKHVVTDGLPPAKPWESHPGAGHLPTTTQPAQQ